MLIKGGKRQVASLISLARLAVRYVYEKETMRADEIALMEDSVVSWSNKANITEEENETLQRIGWFLKRDEMGDFDRRKELFKSKKVDWRKFHRMGAYDSKS